MAVYTEQDVARSVIMSFIPRGLVSSPPLSTYYQVSLSCSIVSAILFAAIIFYGNLGLFYEIRL